MSIPVSCTCGKTFQVKQEHAGKNSRCPSCGEVLKIPVKRSPSTPKGKKQKRQPASGRKTSNPLQTNSKRLSGKMIAGLALGGMLFISIGGWFLFRDDGTNSSKKTSHKKASKSATAWLEANTGEPDPQPPDETTISAETTQSNDDTTSRTVNSHEENANESVATKSGQLKQIESEQKTHRSAQPVVETKPVAQSTRKSKPKKQSNKNNSGKKSASLPLVPTPTKYVKRSRTAVKKLINSVGRTPPDWFDSTPLDYPQTLDLSWPKPPPKGWNNRKNVGQFIWDIINPNQRKWRTGVRFMHHLLIVHQKDPILLGRVMSSLGRMYHELLQDHSRAAFWYQQAALQQEREFFVTRNAAHLAECYWRLGNKQMAVEFLDKLPLRYAGIKLWGDMGETKKAEKLALLAVRNGGVKNQLYLYLGDAFRTAGKYDRAIFYYRKVISVPATGNRKERIKKDHARALANIAAIQSVENLDLSKIPNGTYTASSLGYEAQVHIAVTVRDGRFVAVKVTRHREKQYYSSIYDTTRKILSRQGLKRIDTTSGATITSEAIINATAKALASALQ